MLEWTRNLVINGNCSTTMFPMFSSLKGSIINNILPSNFFAGPTFLIAKLCPIKENVVFVWNKVICRELSSNFYPPIWQWLLSLMMEMGHGIWFNRRTVIFLCTGNLRKDKHLRKKLYQNDSYNLNLK